jgi:hypothetical protein
MPFKTEATTEEVAASKKYLRARDGRVGGRVPNS